MMALQKKRNSNDRFEKDLERAHDALYQSTFPRSELGNTDDTLNASTSGWLFI